MFSLPDVAEGTVLESWMVKLADWGIRLFADWGIGTFAECRIRKGEWGVCCFCWVTVTLLLLVSGSLRLYGLVIVIGLVGDEKTATVTMITCFVCVHQILHARKLLYCIFSYLSERCHGLHCLNQYADSPRLNKTVRGTCIQLRGSTSQNI